MHHAFHYDADSVITLHSPTTFQCTSTTTLLSNGILPQTTVCTLTVNDADLTRNPKQLCLVTIRVQRNEIDSVHLCSLAKRNFNCVLVNSELSGQTEQEAW